MYEEKFIAHNHALKVKNTKSDLIFNIRLYIKSKFDVWDIWDILPSGWKFRYFDFIRPIFIPQNKRIRKVIPRTWTDVSHLIEIVNFEFIKAFYEDEYIDGHVDWDAFPTHREFADWLEAAYKYITVERPQLEKDMDAAYPPLRPIEEWFEPLEETIDGKKGFRMKDDGLTYEEKYGEVNRLEKLIDEKDTDILTEFVKRRHFFWT